MYHHRSTMKIGTDAMILSAWAGVGDANNILDVGTGSGIIALMMAARSNAAIDAVELDTASAREAEQNFNQSPFASRLTIFQDDYTNYASSTTKKYDLIISNPPFFINDMRPENRLRKQARHTDTLSFNQLCTNTKKLLAGNGKFCLVLPYRESRFFLTEAESNGLFLKKKLIIFPRACKEPNRINLEFIKTRPKVITEEKFIIRNEDNSYTKQYIDLLGAYYTSIKA